jgi:type III secretory pathway component EscV
MIPALDYAEDPFGSMIFAGSILDRIHLLARSPDAIPMLKGTYSNKADQGSSAESRYVAILQPPSERDRERQLYVGNGHLLAGPPAALDQRRVALEPSGRDLETASPCRFQDFALIRVGTKLDRGGPTRTIHQLRRERALAGGSLPVQEAEDREEKSYLDRETRLRKARHLTRIFGSDGLQRMPAVAPIVIEIAANLIPMVESAHNTLSPQFQDILNQMKDGLRYELGIEVPGVRVRGNEADLPDGTYIIMINEIPLVSGTVSPDRAMCNATVEQLSSIGVKAEKAINPANGNDCAWVLKKDWETVRQEGKRIRDDGLYLWAPLEYIILHLSSVIRKNAPEFLGVKAVADLIRVKDKAAYPEICAAPGGLPRFTAVLQILLEEEVPILELGAICSRYLALSAAGMATHEIADELRCLHELRPSLRLRSDSIIVYELGKNFVTMLRAGLYQSGDAAVLAIEPEPTQAALTAVRNEVANLPPTAMNPVVLVDDWRLRRPSRKLIELEFPHLWVLARRELADLAHSVSTIGVIEID